MRIDWHLRRLILISVLSLVTLITLVGSPIIAEELLTAECLVAKEWVAANKADIPTTLSDLYTLPPAYRRASFAALSPEDQSRLVRQHYKAFSHDNPKLNNEQRALIDQIHKLAEQRAACADRSDT